VVTEPFDIPVGRVAVVADPFGNILVPVSLDKGRGSCRSREAQMSCADDPTQTAS
jgi:hypothetical protein